MYPNIRKQEVFYEFFVHISRVYPIFTRAILLLDISREFSCSRGASNLADISDNWLLLKFNSRSDVCVRNNSSGNSLSRFSSKPRYLRLVKSLNRSTGSTDSRFFPSNSSSSMVNPWNIPGKKLDIRLQERSSNTSNVVLKKRLSGRFRNLFEDASLHRIKEKIHLILEKGKKKKFWGIKRKKKKTIDTIKWIFSTRLFSMLIKEKTRSIWSITHRIRRFRVLKNWDRCNSPSKFLLNLIRATACNEKNKFNGRCSIELSLRSLKRTIVKEFSLRCETIIKSALRFLFFFFLTHRWFNRVMSKKVSLWSVVSRLPAKSLKATVSLDSNQILFPFFFFFSFRTWIGEGWRRRMEGRLTILTRPEELAAPQEDPTDPASNRTPILFPVDTYTALRRKSPSLPRLSSSAKLNKPFASPFPDST